jgi:hypothetical protein
MDKTIITHGGFGSPTKTLPDPEMKTQGMDTNISDRLKDKAAKITLST